MCLCVKILRCDKIQDMRLLIHAHSSSPLPSPTNDHIKNCNRPSLDETVLKDVLLSLALNPGFAALRELSSKWALAKSLGLVREDPRGNTNTCTSSNHFNSNNNRTKKRGGKLARMKTETKTKAKVC